MAWETIQVDAQHLVDKVNALFEEGNVRHIRLRQGEHILFEIPLNYGVGIGLATVVVAPVLAAVAAVAGVVAHCTLEIERDMPPHDPTSASPAETMDAP